MDCSSKPHEQVRPRPAATLALRDRQPFGLGGRRLCFVHPAEPDKCVKVLRQDPRRTVRSRRSLIPACLRREYDNNAHERKVLEQLARRVGPRAHEHLPRCHGMVETDMGPGLVLDLVRDHDGQISRNLRELISTGHDPQIFRQAIDELGAFLIEHLIVTRALLDHNIAAQQRGDGSWRLYLIDGLGDPSWLPIRRWISPMGRATIQRRLAALWQRCESLKDQPVSQKMIDESSWGQGFLIHRGGKKSEGRSQESEVRRQKSEDRDRSETNDP